MSCPFSRKRLLSANASLETGRVRVHKTVQEHEEVVDAPLDQETVEIERPPDQWDHRAAHPDAPGGRCHHYLPDQRGSGPWRDG